MAKMETMKTLFKSLKAPYKTKINFAISNLGYDILGVSVSFQDVLVIKEILV